MQRDRSVAIGGACFDVADIERAGVNLLQILK
jgi:hypothetical protein